MNIKEYVKYREGELNGVNQHKYLGYNNVHAAYPPFMNDGRIMNASWQPNSDVNNQIIRENNIRSNWQYRQHLIKNGNKVRDYNFKECMLEMGQDKSHNYSETQGNLVNGEHKNPYLYESFMDNSKPFGSTNSDLKETYLSREQLQARKIAPSITQEELLNYKR